MDLPQQYPYNPTLWIIIAGFSFIAFFAYTNFHPSRFELAFAIIFIVFGLLTVLRRFLFKRNLTLTQDALLLPSGFMALKIARVPYENIAQLRQWVQPFGTLILEVKTKEKTFQINSAMFVDTNKYITVKEFLISHTEKNLKSNRDST